VSSDLYGATVVEMGFGSLACSEGVLVGVGRALVGRNARGIAQERVTGVCTWGVCARLWSPVSCAFLFPVPLSLLWLSISFGVSFGYYCVPYRFIVRRLVLFSSLLYVWTIV